MKFDQEISDRICDFFATGDYTQKQVSEMVGIHETTFIRWKNEYPNFANAIKEADKKRLEAIKGKARSSLNKLIEGFEYIEKSIEKVENETVRTKETTKFVPPNVTAVIFALTNIDKENFKRNQPSDQINESDQSINWNESKSYDSK